MTVDLKTDEELMQEFERKAKEAKEANKSFDNFFFFLKEDEKAVVHPLLNVPQMTLTELLYHEKYDHIAGKMVADHVCAADTKIGMKCKTCQEADFTRDKKLKASPRVFLPVYVHGIYKTDLMGKTVAVTAKDDDGVERPVQGVRMLKLKPGGALVDSFKEFYYDSDDRSILTSDFVITRRGSGLDTSYNLTGRKLTPTKGPLPKYSVEKVISDVRLKREEQAIEVPDVDPFVPAGTQEEQPQFTVKEALDMKEPTELQLNAIQKLCKSLDKDFIPPISFGQAANMLRNLKEEFTASLAEE
jgi:hypothetical protein